MSGDDFIEVPRVPYHGARRINETARPASSFRDEVVTEIGSCKPPQIGADNPSMKSCQLHRFDAPGYDPYRGWWMRIAGQWFRLTVE